MKFSKKQLQYKVNTFEKAKASKASYISTFRIALKEKKKACEEMPHLKTLYQKIHG